MVLKMEMRGADGKETFFLVQLLQYNFYTSLVVEQNRV